MKSKNEKNLIPKKTNALTPIVTNTQELTSRQLIQITDEKIKRGLAMPTASTGTPIEVLHGSAKFMAQISNIGAGSVEIGGGGIKESFKTIIQNTSAKSEVKAELRQKTQMGINNTDEKYVIEIL